MIRLHLFELEDQPWFPAIIRDAGTAFLEFASMRAKHGETIAPILSDALRRADSHQIIDLCSGGSGPLPVALAVIKETRKDSVTAVLTDLYPNQNAFRKITEANPAITARSEPVDAMAVPKEMTGTRTLFNGFHHFRPEQARKILQNAVDEGAPIALFEFVQRHPLAMLGMLFAPLAALIVLPFLRPFRWGWIPLTYLIPIIPLFIGWDGFVSCLRCYNQNELRALTESASSAHYEWQVGQFKMPRAPFKGSFVIGTPRKSSTASVTAVQG
ncbi:MAG: class I SAM-dependent methyltransferase [Myxococcota bacterium]